MLEELELNDENVITEKPKGTKRKRAARQDIEEAVEGNGGKCSICGKEFFGYGNNAQPINDERCCDECNIKKVIPARLNLVANKKKTVKESAKRSIARYLKNWARDDYENGQVLSLNDFDEFYGILDDDGFRISKEEAKDCFNKYFEFLDDIMNEGYNWIEEDLELNIDESLCGKVFGAREDANKKDEEDDEEITEAIKKIDKCLREDWYFGKPVSTKKPLVEILKDLFSIANTRTEMDDIQRTEIEFDFSFEDVDGEYPTCCVSLSKDLNDSNFLNLNKELLQSDAQLYVNDNEYSIVSFYDGDCNDSEIEEVYDNKAVALINSLQDSGEIEEEVEPKKDIYQTVMKIVDSLPEYYKHGRTSKYILVEFLFTEDGPFMKASLKKFKTALDEEGIKYKEEENKDYKDNRYTGTLVTITVVYNDEDIKESVRARSKRAVRESAEGDKVAQDYIDDKNANFEKDKETTREVRKELAKNGIATEEDGTPINEEACQESDDCEKDEEESTDNVEESVEESAETIEENTIDLEELGKKIDEATN